jgi:hypothetical protein
MIHAEWEVLSTRVHKWARENVTQIYYHNAPYVWWHEALTAGVITREEYYKAYEWYGNLWNYVGD